MATEANEAGIEEPEVGIDDLEDAGLADALEDDDPPPVGDGEPAGGGEPASDAAGEETGGIADDDYEWEPLEAPAEDKGDPEQARLERAIERVAMKVGAGAPAQPQVSQGDPLAAARQRVESLYAEAERLEDEGASQAKVQRAIRAAERAEAELAAAEQWHRANQERVAAEQQRHALARHAESVAEATIQRHPGLAAYRGVIRAVAAFGDEARFAGLGTQEELARALRAYAREKQLVLAPRKKPLPSPVSLGASSRGASPGAAPKALHSEAERRWLKKNGIDDADIAEAEAHGIRLLD